MQNIGLVNEALSIVMRETYPLQLQEKNKIILKQQNKIKKLKKIIKLVHFDPDYVCWICEEFSQDGKGIFQCDVCEKFQHKICDIEMLHDVCVKCREYRSKNCGHLTYFIDICGDCAYPSEDELEASTDASSS